MSKFHCPCGWAISDVGFPSHEERHVISDRDLDGATNYGAEPMTIDVGRFDECQRDMLECSQCGRLHLQDAPHVNHYTTYAREVDAEAHVVKLEAALVQILYTYESDPGYDEARVAAGKLLKREP